MTHVGEESRLQFVRHFGFLFGCLKFPFDLLQFRDVPFDADDDGGGSSSPSTRIFRLSRMISFPFLSFPSVVQCSPRPVVATSVSSSLFFSATSGG